MLSMAAQHPLIFFFFFNDTATTEIYTLSLHDALPISSLTSGTMRSRHRRHAEAKGLDRKEQKARQVTIHPPRSEEHTSELQSQSNLVCRLLLEKKKKKKEKHKSDHRETHIKLADSKIH